MHRFTVDILTGVRYMSEVQRFDFLYLQLLPLVLGFSVPIRLCGYANQNAYLSHHIRLNVDFSVFHSHMRSIIDTRQRSFG